MLLDQSRSKSAIAALCVFALTFAAGLSMVALGEKKRLEVQRQIALNKALDHSARLRAAVARGLSATHVFSALLRQDEGGVADFSELARELLPQFGALGALILAPRGTVALGYPPELAERWLADIRSLDAARTKRPALAGPFMLQGAGKALVAHLPVFLDRSEAGERFWGSAAAVILLAKLEEAAQLPELRDQGFRYQVSREHPETRERQMLFGSSEPLRDPLTYDFEVHRGQWRLSIEPQRGWLSYDDLGREAALFGLLALVAAGFAHRVGREPGRLRRLVQARTAALSRANESLQKLSTAVIQNPASVVITDLQGRIEYVNPKFEELTGYSLAEVKGRKPSLLKSGETPAALYQELWRTISAGKVWRGEIRNRAKNGALFWESQIIAPVKDAAGAVTHFIAVKEDVTARKNDECHLRKLNHTLKMISACNEALVRSVDEAELMREVCRVAVELGDYPLAWVGEVQQDEQKTIRPVAYAGCDPEFMRHINASALDIPIGRGATGTAIRTTSTVVVRELLGSPRYAPWRELFEQRGYRTAVAFPLVNDAGAFGALTLYSRDAAAFDEEEVDLLEEMASDLGYGISALRTRAEHRVALEALQESEERFRSITTSARDAIIVIDESARVTYWNPAAERLFGYPCAAALGRDLHELITPERFRTDARRGFERFAASVEGSAIGKAAEFVGMRADASEFPFELSVSAARIRGRYCAVGVIRDISERKSYERELERQATRDPLTGLPNRSLLRDRMGQAMSGARRKGREVAVLVVDLDRFKNVNDSLGHFAGDSLLKVAADRLARCLRETDTVARYGGDEFAIVMPDIEDEERLTGVLQRIIDEVSRPILLAGREVSTSCSLGIALYPKDGSDIDALLRNADMALYKAKESGRRGFYFFTQDLNAKATERVSLEIALRRALEQDELLLHYQPQFDLKTGRAIGMEALLRWRHPALGLVPPGRFIPIAEDSGLIVPIGDWVLREACRQAMAWQAAGMAGVPVAVNLSALQFRQKGFVERVERILEDTGMPPERLELELTESIVMHDVEWVRTQLHALKARGIQLSIDDFGTGYSSLKYLRQFPVDRLKIDMAFVREIDKDPGAAAISELIIDIGHTLGMRVIAEGVETMEQAAVLRSQGCDHAQGFLLSPPLPVDELEKRVASDQASPRAG